MKLRVNMTKILTTLFSLQSVLKHYDSNCDQILQGIELKAFVGDLVRSCPDIPYNFAMIEQACNYIQVGFSGSNLTGKFQSL